MSLKFGDLAGKKAAEQAAKDAARREQQVRDAMWRLRKMVRGMADQRAELGRLEHDRVWCRDFGADVMREAVRRLKEQIY